MVLIPYVRMLRMLFTCPAVSVNHIMLYMQLNLLCSGNLAIINGADLLCQFMINS
jgi:hypothetical protein